VKTILTISLTVHALMFFDYARDVIRKQISQRKWQKYYEEEMREYEKKSDKSKQKQRRANKNVDPKEHNNW
jgi:queuine/archaeosine tRNA-ribosyltransferase